MSKRIGKRWRPVLAYALTTLLCVGVNFLYGLFAHGVGSGAMAYMFLYPLLGGCAFFLLLALLLPDIGKAGRYRLFFNLYNAGVATLTVHGFLLGVLEIAGTASAYTATLRVGGWVFIAMGLLFLLTLPFSFEKKSRRQADA